MKTIDAEPGETSYAVSVRACNYATSFTQEINVQHNNVTVRVFPNSNPTDIYEKLYYKACIDKNDIRLY